LAAAPGPARPLAGGTDLLLDLKQGRQPPVHTLVDLTTIPELTALEIRAETLFIGAAVSLSHMVESNLVQQHAQALAEAGQLVGGPQVAQHGHPWGQRSPCAPGRRRNHRPDGAPGASRNCRSTSRRMVPVASLFLGPGKSLINPEHEILVGFHLPVRKAPQASVFRRIMRSQGTAPAILNVSVWLERKNGVYPGCAHCSWPGWPNAMEGGCRRRQPARPALFPGSFCNCPGGLVETGRFSYQRPAASAEYRAHLVDNLLTHYVSRLPGIGQKVINENDRRYRFNIYS